MNLDENEYTKEDLPALDRRAQRQGKYEEWMMSEQRKHIAGPNNVVRIVTWKNMDEICQKASFNIHELSRSYQESLNTGDVIFVEYEEVDS